MKFCFVFADTPSEWNCSQWRVANPSYGLRRIGHDVDEMWVADFAASPHDATLRKRVQAADVVLLQRNCFEDKLDALKFWRGLGKPVYIDLDDAYQMLPETVLARRFWRDNASKFARNPLEQLREGLRLSSGVTSPSKVILQDWDAPKRVWLPNFVRAEWYTHVERRPHYGVVIGWGVSMSHFDSFRYSGAVEALTRICREHDAVRVVLVSNDSQPFEMLTGIRPQQKQWMRGVEYTKWPSILAQFDIGLAPLYGEYDRRRSWLKVPEYACAGVPCVVTKSDPYAGLEEWCIAQVENSVDNWYAALSTALDNLAHAKQVAEHRRLEAALAFSIEARAGDWLKALQ
jgi:glycosyltransferase involved in cell wall biosynthesis